MSDYHDASSLYLGALSIACLALLLFGFLMAATWPQYKRTTLTIGSLGIVAVLGVFASGLYAMWVIG